MNCEPDCYYNNMAWCPISRRYECRDCFLQYTEQEMLELKEKQQLKPIGYFFGIFYYADHPITIYKINLTKSEFEKEIVKDDTWDFPCLDGKVFDRYEEIHNKKLYLCESMALGVAKKCRENLLANERRKKIAIRSGKKRKLNEWGLLIHEMAKFS